MQKHGKYANKRSADINSADEKGARRKGFTSIGYKISGILIGSILLLSVITGMFSYFMYREESISKYAGIVQSIALSIAATMDIDEFSESMRLGERTPYQQASRLRLEQIKYATGMEFVYVVGPPIDGYFPYFVAASFDIEVGYLHGSEFFADEIFNAFRTGEPAVSRIYFAGEDEHAIFGYLISGFAPVLDREGVVIAVVGVDVSVDQALAASTTFGYYIFAFTIVTTIVFIAVTHIASTKLIFKPFNQLMISIARTKVNMNESVYGIDRNDEIGDLANTVQNMKDNLIDALGKLHYDALTGIYNRRFLEENISRIIESLSHSKGLLSVIMLDVDFFKRYNDTYGHSKGDECLRFVAIAMMNSITRESDFVARYGGEEFIIILPNTDEKGARIIAEKVLKNVRECDIPHESNDVADYVTVSIGVTTCNVDATSNGEDYIKRADEALYKSKNGGRNRYTFLN